MLGLASSLPKGKLPLNSNFLSDFSLVIPTGTHTKLGAASTNSFKLTNRSSSSGMYL